MSSHSRTLAHSRTLTLPNHKTLIKITFPAIEEQENNDNELELYERSTESLQSNQKQAEDQLAADDQQLNLIEYEEFHPESSYKSHQISNEPEQQPDNNKMKRRQQLDR